MEWIGIMSQFRKCWPILGFNTNFMAVNRKIWGSPAWGNIMPSIRWTAWLAYWDLNFNICSISPKPIARIHGSPDTCAPKNGSSAPLNFNVNLGHLRPSKRVTCTPKIQGVRPFRLGGDEPSWTSFTSKGYDRLGWAGALSWTSFTSTGYHRLGWGGGNYHGHPLLPRGTTL